MDEFDDFNIDLKTANSEEDKIQINEETTLLVDEIELKPVWSDESMKLDEKKVYSCLDTIKVLKHADKVKKSKAKSRSLLNKNKIFASKILNFHRCTDGNRDHSSSKHISFALCHPNKICLITGAEDSLLGVFKVDGERNAAVCKPFYYERFPIKGGRILPDGKRLIFHSKFNSFNVFDLNTFVTNKFFIENNSVIIRRMEVSPAGDIIVFSSNKGVVYIVSTKSFDVIDKVQISGKVRSMAFSHKGKYLYVYGDRGIVFVYEFPENGRATFLRQWVDEGSMNGSAICISKDEQYLACGSSTFDVNIYNLNDTWKSENPKPIKTVTSTGRVNLLAFNNSSQILALGSTMAMNSQRLIHLESMTIFTNFPGTKSTQRPTSFSFSPNDKFMAIGQSNGKVALYSFDYYNQF